MKSNQGIHEEFVRHNVLPATDQEPACTNEDCPNIGKGIKSYPDLYKKFGKTASGSQRYRCKACRSTISEPKRSITRQRRSHLNRFIFKAIVNKNPFRCISDIFDVSIQTVYDKVDFIYKQCCKFIEVRETRLLKGMKLPKMYIAVDRQYYSVNWNLWEDRRNVILYGTGAADNTSGYVFAMDVNYNPALDQIAIEGDAEAIGDYDRDPPFRRYAHLWLLRDFEETFKKAVEKAENEKGKRKKKLIPESDISRRYRLAKKRKNIEASDEINEAIQLPQSGMMVHSEYSLYGLFLHLKELLQGAEKVRFFMDQESGIRAACLSAFRREILNRTCDAFYVRINRAMTRKERKKAVQAGEKALREYARENDLDENEARLHMLLDELSAMAEIGPWQDRWFTHPLPTYKEPEIQICYLTDLGDYTADHKAWLYNKASLHYLSTYFGNVRRKLSMLERSFPTPSSLGRKWYAYAPYNPTIINKLLLIHRVHYNFVKKKGQKETPAMRLGLAQTPIEPDDVLYSKGMAFSRRQAFARYKERTKEPFLKGPEPDTPRPAPIPTPKPVEPPAKKPTIEPAPFVFLDTETTGITLNDQIIEIAIVDEAGIVLVDSLVWASCPISDGAYQSHKITADMLADAPSFEDIENTIAEAVRGKYVVMYNASFDLRYLTSRIRDAMKGHFCCMIEFAKAYGEYSSWHNNYAFKKLGFAADFVKHSWTGPTHRALADALACRSIWMYLHASSKKASV
jgi:DNA polymerase III epsilon subunit-like protein/transposase-like protein